MSEPELARWREMVARATLGNEHPSAWDTFVYDSQSPAVIHNRVE